MTGQEYVDEGRNFERLDLYLNIPNVGYGLLQEFIDLTNQVITIYIPSVNYCQKYEIPFKLNIKEYFDRIESLDPLAVQYLGIRALEWNNTKSDIAFLILSPDPSIKEDATQIAYADQTTLKLEAAQLVYKNLVVLVPGGQVAATFTDDFFKLPAACENVEISGPPKHFRSFMQ